MIDDALDILNASNRFTQLVVFLKEKLSIHIDFYGPFTYIPIIYHSGDDISKYLHLDITPDEQWDPSNIGVNMFYVIVHGNLYTHLCIVDILSRDIFLIRGQH